MKKLRIGLLLSFIFLGMSLTGLQLTAPSMLTVGTNNFDVARWLDADIFIIKWSLGFFIVGFLLNLISFLFSLRLKK